MHTLTHFVVPQGSNRRCVAIGTSASYSGTRRRRDSGNFDNGVYYNGQSNQKVSNWECSVYLARTLPLPAVALLLVS